MIDEGDKKNFQIMCARCTEERRQHYQKNNKDYKYLKGDSVKIGFFDQNNSGEYMWVHITKVHDNLVCEGILQNEPVFIWWVKQDDPIHFNTYLIHDRYLDSKNHIIWSDKNPLLKLQHDHNLLQK